MESKVVVTLYSDQQCKDCATLDALLALPALTAYWDRVRFLHRDFPLPKHDWARRAAIAARAFDRVACGLAAEWRTFLFPRLKETTADMLDDRIREFATSVGADAGRVFEEMADPVLEQSVDADIAGGQERGVTRTPTLFIGGETLIEPQSAETITAVLDRALAANRPVAVITGASRGIGRGIAIELSRTHRVVATYRGRRDAAESLAAETGAEIFQCDIASGADRAGLLAFTRDKFGRLDLLVNNAGMAPRERRDILDATEESFDELIATNLRGPHFLTRDAARWMSEQGGGRIVFITSISAFTASVNRAEYCISKAGLSMSAALYAARLAGKGVLVFEIQPGIIRTDMIATVESVYEERIANGLLPQRRMGEASDIARAVFSIASGHLDYSAGQVLHVDGGFHLRTL